MCKRAQQYDRATKLLKSFTDKAIPTQLLVEIRELERRHQQQRAADLAMASDLRSSRTNCRRPIASFGNKGGGSLEGPG